MGRGRKILVEEEDYSSSDSDSRYGDPIRIERKKQSKDIWRASSKSRPYKHAAEQIPVVINNRLAIPVGAGGGRTHRANSTGAQPSPVVILANDRSPSRSRSRHHHHYHRSSESSSSRSRSRSKHGKSRHGSQAFNRDNLPYDLRKQLDAVAEVEERQRRERQWEDDKRRIEEQERKEKDKKERYLRDLHDQEVREKEKEKERKDRMMHDMEEQERKEEQKKERMLQDFKDKQRKDDEKRLAIIREQEEKEKEAKIKREEFARQIKEEEAEKKRKQEDLEHRIMMEVEEKKKKKEADDKALKERILREAKEDEEKEKAKKKKADEEFELRVRAQALKAGWSADYVEDLLGKEKEERRHHHHGHRAHSPASIGRREHELMLEYERPTWIRISRKHILPETLEYYRLRWDYDEEDRDYIMIKEYINHDLQRELFEHTKTIMRNRKLITPGYVKESETITTLKPRDERVIKKKNNQMYVVRRKSVSPAPRRLSFVG